MGISLAYRQPRSIYTGPALEGLWEQAAKYDHNILAFVIIMANISNLLGIDNKWNQQWLLKQAIYISSHAVDTGRELCPLVLFHKTWLIGIGLDRGMAPSR